MERLCELYFEISNEDRLGILYGLEEKRNNVTGIARELDLTTQECSRHLSRLQEAGLVARNPEGLYDLSQYGRSFLRLIPGQRFIAEHGDYFSAHTLDGLPSEFVSRIGELRGSETIDNVMVAFSFVESIFKNAGEFLVMIHDQYLPSILPLGVEALKRDVKFRSVELKKKKPGRSLDPIRPDYITEEDEEYFIQAWIDGKVKPRFSETVEVFLYLTEKEALIAFPLVDGAFDYTGFTSRDPAMREYCQDLFDYYWERGEDPPRDGVEERHELRKTFHRGRENPE